METISKKEAAAIKWNSDSSHSELGFKVRHMMITNVKGEFRKFKASVVSKGLDFRDATIDVTIDATSLATGDDQRDGHLRSADFFDVDKYPVISFKGISFRRLDGDEYQLRGILEIKGVKKEVSFGVEFGGMSKDPWSNEKVGFAVEGRINRKDFGLSWNVALETGGVLVSDEVKILAEIQFIKTAQ